MKDERTSQSALNDVEVRDVAEEIRRTRCIGIALLFLTATTVHAICPRRISINRNHLGPVIGKGIAVCVRAHFDIQRFSGVFLRSGMGEGTWKTDLQTDFMGLFILSYDSHSDT
jgi:hypothetical protein